MKTLQHTIHSGTRLQARTRLLFFLLAACHLPLSTPLSAAPPNSVSAYKPLMVGTTNEVLPAADTNFFNANSNLLNSSVAGGGGGGGSGTTLNNVTGALNLAFVNETGTSNGIGYAISGTNFTVYVTNAASVASINGLIGAVTGFLTNNFAGVVSFASSLTVDGAVNCLNTVNGAAAAFTAGVAGGSLNIASNATVGGALTVNGANFSLVSPGSSTVVLSMVGQGAGGSSNSISTSPAGLLLNTPGDVIIDAPANQSLTVGPALLVQNNAAINTNLTVGGTLAVTGATTLASTLGVTGLVTATGFTSTSGEFSGSGGGLTAIPASAITGPIPSAAYGFLPATNLDHSLGYAIITNCYHDYQSATNGAITNSVHLYGGPFTVADVGKEIDFNTGPNQLATTIASYDGPTEVDLAASYSGTVHNVFYGWGHDDSATINMQVSNLWTYSNISTFFVPPGNYFLNTWTILPTGSSPNGVASQFWIPTTNVDEVSNAPSTLALLGQAVPTFVNSYFSNISSAYGNQPIPTNGAIFNTILAPAFNYGTVNTNITNVMIGLPSKPAYASGGFLNLKIVLKNLTFRTYPTPLIDPIDMAYVGQCSLENIAVDNGISQSYTAAPANTGNYAIRFPFINNFAGCVANNCVVAGYYNGYGVSEHLQAGNLYSTCCNEALRMLQGNHANHIARLIDQGEPSGIYNSGAPNTTCIGEWDCEADTSLTGGAAVQAWQLRSWMLYDPNNDQYGMANFIGTIPATQGWCAATNNGGTNFSMPNLRNFLLTAVNNAQFTTLIVSSNTARFTNSVASYDTNLSPANLYNTGTQGTTNISGRNIEVDVNTSSATIVKFDNAGNAWDTNSSLTIGYVPIFLQPGGYFTNNGTVTITGQHAL